MLESITGSQVTVQEVTAYHNYHGPAQDLTHGSPDSVKSVVVATVLHSVKDVDQLQHQRDNQTELIATAGKYQSENRLLFWILLIILLLIAIALITLLCCCLCPCCPLFTTTRKKCRVHTAENVHFAVKEDHGQESKAVQAEWNGADRKEAWSSDTYTHSSWHFNRRNTHHAEPQRVLLVAREGDMSRRKPPPVHHQPLSVIYTHDMAKQQDQVILEDVDGTEYRVLDPSRLSLPTRVDDDADAESICRHEFDRGSDRGKGHREEISAGPESQPRHQMFIRDGNAEILRLITRGRVEEEETNLNQPDARPYTVVEGVESINKQEEKGKEIIMQRFIEDQKKSTETTLITKEQERKNNGGSINGTEEKKDEGDNLLQRLMDVPQRNLSTHDVNRLTTLQRDLLLTRFLVEEQKRAFAHVPVHDDTQSLPGIVTNMCTMATQTDVNRGTQTEILYTMRPPRRKAKSDLDDSGESDTETSVDVHRKLLRKYNKRKRTVPQDLDISERGRSLSRCEIKTPILEETESAMETMGENINQPHYSKGIASQSGFTATKSSMLRLQMTRKKLQEGNLEDQTLPQLKFNNMSVNSGGALVGSKRKSISDQNLPLARTMHRNLEQETVAKSLQTSPGALQRGYFTLHQNRGSHEIICKDENDSDEELCEDIFERSKSSLSTRNASTSPIQTYTKRKSSSAERLSYKSDKRKESPKKNMTKSATTHMEGRKTQSQSRYMEWYKTKKEERERQKSKEKELERQRVMKPVKPIGQRLSRSDTPVAKINRIHEQTPSKTTDIKAIHSQMLKKQNAVKQNVISLFQENRKSNITSGKQITGSPEKDINLKNMKEENKHNGTEDDQDSGIAMLAPGSQKMKRKNQNLMEKKSVFTIAYDDMQTKQLRLDSASPP